MHSHSGDCKEVLANDGILQTLTDLGRNISEELINQAEELTRSLKRLHGSWRIGVWIPRTQEKVWRSAWNSIFRRQRGNPQTKLARET